MSLTSTRALPDTVVQEIRNALAVVCREIVMKDGAEGKKEEQQDQDQDELPQWKRRIMNGLKSADSRERKLEEESDKLLFAKPMKQIVAYYNQVGDFSHPIEIDEGDKKDNVSVLSGGSPAEEAQDD